MPRFKAAFLDRDGTLNTEIEYLHRIEDLEWIPGAVEAVARLNQAGVIVLVATNQAGVARGLYSERDVDILHEHMQAELSGRGAHIDGFYYCPFHPEGSVPEYARPSRCRKPDTGMLEEGLADWGLLPSECVVVGDKSIDIEAGRSLGMSTILVLTGYGRQQEEATPADHIAGDLTAATDIILSESRS